LVVPTSTSFAPEAARMSGIRNSPPISISSPRETRTCFPLASAAKASSNPAAPLFTTTAASAPVIAVSISSARWVRRSRAPLARSTSKSL
jgi:hypothetical protein